MRKKGVKDKPKAVIHKKHHRYILSYLKYRNSAVKLREIKQAMYEAGFIKPSRQDIHSHLSYLQKMSLIFKKGRNNYFISKKGEKLLIAYASEKLADRIYESIN